MWPFSTSNTAIISQKRAQRADALQEEFTEQQVAILRAAGALQDTTQEFTEQQATILKASVSDIVSHIQRGEWTASTVLEAYIGRAVLAQKKTNCITEVFFDRARKRAAELDSTFASTKTLVGPLHGVPISLKDTFDVEGLDTTIGFTRWANKPATSNADIVNKVIAAGAVIFVKTNVPQTMFAFECSNPLWGRSTNPYGDGFTCGGSSGGEAALLAMDGAAVGLGTDIGGSLRTPAAYCGIYSLKPAAGRVSFYGAQGPVPGFEGISTVAGPMGRSIKDLGLLSRVIFGSPSTENDIPPLPFREVQVPKKLKFGYYTSDKYIKASPANQRAVLETVEALRKAGHECVEFELPDSQVACYLFAGMTSADGYKTMFSHLGPDKKEDSLFLATLGPQLPGFLRVFAAWLMDKVLGDKLFADGLRSSRTKGVTEYWDLLVQKRDYARRFNKIVWEEHGFDSIVAPVQALPQAPHGTGTNFSALAVSAFIYNIVDLPAGCLPVTYVDAEKDKLTKEWLDGPGHGSSLMEDGIFKGKNPIYNPKALHGMPVGIQVVGKKWEEETLLGIMAVVDEALGERGFGAGSWEARTKKPGP